MGVELGGTAVRAVAVVTAQSPVRGLIIEKLLTDSVAKHGWGERMTVAATGIACGAGELDAEHFESLDRNGIQLDMQRCPSVEEDPDLLEEADSFVCAATDEADVVLQWPAAAGKRIYALTDFLGDDGWACEDPGAELALFIDQVREAIPLLLRALVAVRG